MSDSHRVTVRNTFIISIDESPSHLCHSSLVRLGDVVVGIASAVAVAVAVDVKRKLTEAINTIKYHRGLCAR